MNPIALLLKISKSLILALLTKLGATVLGPLFLFSNSCKNVGTFSSVHFLLYLTKVLTTLPSIRLPCNSSNGFTISTFGTPCSPPKSVTGVDLVFILSIFKLL